MLGHNRDSRVFGFVRTGTVETLTPCTPAWMSVYKV